MLRFYADQQFDGHVTQGLRSRGIDVLTAFEDGHDKAEDPTIVDRAGELGRILLSQDTDMLIIGNQRQESGEYFTGIVYVRQDRSMKGAYIEQIEEIASCCTWEELQCNIVYLPM